MQHPSLLSEIRAKLHQRHTWIMIAITAIIALGLGLLTGHLARYGWHW